MAIMRMIAVVAMAENRVIGDGKGLIWHIPGDLKRVKTLTMNCPLIMGRKTWDSIGRPLPGRASIVMTRDRSWTADGAIAVPNLKAAIEAARNWIENTVGSHSEIILFGCLLFSVRCMARICRMNACQTKRYRIILCLVACNLTLSQTKYYPVIFCLVAS